VSLFDVELNTAMVVAPEEVAPPTDTSAWEVA
jgi:hypothetical protein